MAAVAAVDSRVEEEEEDDDEAKPTPAPLAVARRRASPLSPSVLKSGKIHGKGTGWKGEREEWMSYENEAELERRDGWGKTQFATHKLLPMPP